MKLTAGQVYGAIETIKKLEAVKLPLKGKYWIGRVSDALSTEYTRIMTERNELIKEYGEEVNGQATISHTLETEKDGVKTIVINPKLIEFSKDFNTVLEQEIEVNCPKVKLSDLGSGDTEVDLTALLPFIDDEQEKPK
jgi:hypothetical protein